MENLTKEELQKNAEEIFGKESPQAKAERLEMERFEKFSQLKKSFLNNKGEGMEEVTNFIIDDLNLKEKTVSIQRIESSVEEILDTEATSYVIREISGKIKRKVYFFKGSSVFRAVKATELLKKELPEEMFVIKPLIPLGGLTIIAGQPGIGKSWFSFEVLRVIGNGEKLFGQFDSIKQRVLLVDEESNEPEIQRRLRKLGISNEDFEILSQKGIKFDNENMVKDLLNFAKGKFDLIVFDSLRSLHNLDENSSKETQQLVDAFREFNREGISIIAIHHSRKEGFMASKDPSQVLRGSSALLAGIDSLLSIDGKERDENTIEMSVIQAKLRRGKKSRPFRLLLVENEGKMEFKFNGELQDTIAKKIKAKELIRELFRLEGKKSRKEIIKLLQGHDIGQRTISEALKELKEAEEIDSEPGKGREVLYGL